MNRTIAVVSAGLSQPSSTRLLADQLGGSVDRALRLAGDDVRVEVVELRDLAHAITDHLLTGFPSGALLEDGALEGKPVLLAATAGTARHSLALEFALRPLFAYLRADVPTAVFAAAEDFGGGSSGTGSLSARVDRAGRELAGALTGRDRSGPVDPFENPTPFSQLLGGG